MIFDIAILSMLVIDGVIGILILIKTKDKKWENLLLKT